jgi:hypothetical protein
MKSRLNGAWMALVHLLKHAGCGAPHELRLLIRALTATDPRLVECHQDRARRCALDRRARPCVLDALMPSMRVRWCHTCDRETPAISSAAAMIRSPGSRATRRGTVATKPAHHALFDEETERARPWRSARATRRRRCAHPGTQAAPCRDQELGMPLMRRRARSAMIASGGGSTTPAPDPRS